MTDNATQFMVDDHNRLCAALTSEDGIPRLTWQQHTAAFRAPAVDLLAKGSKVAAWDSATPGTVGECRDGLYDVTFADLHADGSRPCRYRASELRLWPIGGAS